MLHRHLRNTEKLCIGCWNPADHNFEVCDLLGCYRVSLGLWFLTFRSSVVCSYSKVDGVQLHGVT